MWRGVGHGFGVLAVSFHVVSGGVLVGINRPGCVWALGRVLSLCPLSLPKRGATGGGRTRPLGGDLCYALGYIAMRLLRVSVRGGHN
jgi:hypothetical protein